MTVNPATHVPNATVAAACTARPSLPAVAPVPTASASAGALPAGLTLSPAGVLGGTSPLAAGTFNFTAQATDSSGAPDPFSGTWSHADCQSADDRVAYYTLPAATFNASLFVGHHPRGGTVFTVRRDRRVCRRGVARHFHGRSDGNADRNRHI